MRAQHVTSDRQYRSPFGATRVGGAVSLSIDVWDEPEATAQLRTWVDERGERLHEMVRTECGDHLRFSVELVPGEAQVIWYSFNITAADGTVWRYGAAAEHACGEGAFAFGEPPSFQITVYEALREELPSWYADGIAYQVFPDRFARGEGWRAQAEAALAQKRMGPERRLVDDWATPVSYERTEDGRIKAWDFYGGTLEGVREKLGYLEALGISVLYLNPIFEAASNHRYDTADYLRIDPMLGTEEDFSRLCAEAGEHGISIILDGVFNHVGADSRYFNRWGNYDGPPAEDVRSPYHSWFEFNDDGTYAAWWGVDDLPAVRDDCNEFKELICGRDGVVRKWLRLGARGWRLDVADELTDAFIEDIKAAALAERPDAVVIGEVWEDASNKVAYGKLRRYFQGRELDGTMNYPLRDGVLGFVTGAMGAQELAASMQSLCENYPRANFMGELNLLGSHDRMRLLTTLGEAPSPAGLTEEQRGAFRLSDDQRGLAVSRLWVAALLQMTMPGVPCVYYGDEAGVEGYADPFNRATFPWGGENRDCFNIYRNTIALRKALPVLTHGSFRPFADGDDVFGFWRTDERTGERVCVLVNRSLSNTRTVRIPAEGLEVDDVVGARSIEVRDGYAEVFLWQLGTAVLNLRKAQRLQAPMERGMGVFCHITSLPNLERPGRPGTLGEPARRFVDDLAAAGQRYWQVLPVNPTDSYGSPYAGLSAFAGNTSLMWGVDGDGAEVSSDFEGTAEYRRFLEENEAWLVPYATFRTIKGLQEGRAWQEWPERYRSWSPRLARSKELAAGVRSECARQFAFMRQWGQLRSYANERGIKIIGDMPIYVSADSSDVWADRELFMLGEDGWPAGQAGCPPDAMAADGQLWGNPTYNWRVMREQGYEWWMRRLARAFELYDYVRLDHFLGFSSYYCIEAGKSAREGAWRFGPGSELFERAFERFGPLPVVAEDLGTITPAVRALMSVTGFPGMDVIQFADGDVRQGYAPARGKLVYTSTHDTSTLLGWVERSFFGCDSTSGQAIAPQELERAYALARELRERCLASPADVVIMPLQDAMMLDDSARMNVPGVAEGNWSWRADAEAQQVARAVLAELAARSAR